MAGWGKPALALMLAGLFAAIAIGCGGDDSTTAAGTASRTDATTGADGGSTTAEAPSRGSGGDRDSTSKGDSGAGGGSSAEGDGGSGKGSGSGGSGSGSGGGGSSGGGQGGSGSGTGGATPPAGDTSVEEFGAEASASEREQASAVLQTYMSARAAEQHQRVCASLSKAAIAQLRDLAEAVPGVGRESACVAIFAAIDEATPPATRASTMTGPISSLRIEGDRAFAIYTGTKNTEYTMPMDREGGAWKVGALAPFPIS